MITLKRIAIGLMAIMITHPALAMPPDHQKAKKCTDACSAKRQGDLDWSAACIDYCNCIHISKQSKVKCNKEFKGATGQDAPLVVAPKPPTRDRPLRPDLLEEREMIE
ncbi:MAG: hypothetical protein D3910_25685 [Candidatus Electrothrix sp. ATG2]|nr:hypothetical protein [Candidatus Electrothrix sp. ATG2]